MVKNNSNFKLLRYEKQRDRECLQWANVSIIRRYVVHWCNPKYVRFRLMKLWSLWRNTMLNTESSRMIKLWKNAFLWTLSFVGLIVSIDTSRHRGGIYQVSSIWVGFGGSFIQINKKLGSQNPRCTSEPHRAKNNHPLVKHAKTEATCISQVTNSRAVAWGEKTRNLIGQSLNWSLTLSDFTRTTKASRTGNFVQETESTSVLVINNGTRLTEGFVDLNVQFTEKRQFQLVNKY